MPGPGILNCIIKTMANFLINMLCPYFLVNKYQMVVMQVISLLFASI